MKRLTKRLEDEQAVMNCTGCSESWNTNPAGKCTALYCRNILKDRLAAYEDTGLEPEEIKAIAGLASENCAKAADAIDKFLQDDAELKSYRELGSIGRLRELALTDREGKIPKYTIGDTVYDKYGEPWQVVSAELHSMRTKNEWLYRCGHEGTDDYCALWHFEAFPSREAALRREQDE